MKKTLGFIVSLVLVIGSLSGTAYARRARPPANDHSSAAAVIETLPFTSTVSLAGATLEPDEAAPSCSAIRSSVWYALHLPEDGTVLGDVSSTFPAAIAVYEQAADGSLLEVGCSFGGAAMSLEFDGSTAKLYLVQLSATRARQGVADISLRMSTWKEETLIDHVFEQKVDETYVPVLRVHGRPRASDSSMYDVTVASGTWQQSFGVLTYGLVTKEVERELARIPAIAARVRLQITARYDSSQHRCAVDDGSSTCYAGVPLRDPEWLTGGEGSRAELTVTISAEKDGQVLVERTSSVPYAGQVVGLLP